MTDSPHLVGAVSSDPEGEDPTEGAHHGLRWRVLAVIGVVVILAGAGIGAGLLLKPSDARATIDDDFDRTSAQGLGATDGHEWEGVSGAFAVDGGEAVVSRRNADGPRTITVIDVGATNATITATAGSTGPGWGIVFRYVSPFDYWYLQAVPDFAVMNVVRVVNGTATTVGHTAVARIAEGMTVTVVLRGPTVEVRLRGAPVFVTNSRHALGAHKAGLIALGDGEDLTWRRFTAEPNKSNPGPGKAQVDRSDEEAPSTSTDTSPGSTVGG